MHAVVRDLDPAADGFVRFDVVQPDGSPGLTFHFGHVTPAAGLSRGTRITAGQVVATMFYPEGVDFGLTNNDVQHNWISPARYIEEYLHEQHPIEQYPEPLRSQLLERVTSRSAKDRLVQLACWCVRLYVGFAGLRPIVVQLPLIELRRDIEPGHPRRVETGEVLNALTIR